MRAVHNHSAWMLFGLCARLHMLWQAPPVAISETAGSPSPYTRVTCHGQLLHDRSFLVGPRPRSSMGQARPGCAWACVLAYAVPVPLHACRVIFEAPLQSALAAGG